MQPIEKSETEAAYQIKQVKPKSSLKNRPIKKIVKDVSRYKKPSIEENKHKVDFYGADRISIEAIKYNENQKESIDLYDEVYKEK